jgi:hypothetical protein
VLSEYIGYLVAQQGASSVAHSALPDAPVVPAGDRRGVTSWLAPGRGWLSDMLHRLADRLALASQPNTPLALPRRYRTRRI